MIDGNWGPWSLVGTCSSECGPGVKTRQRSCTNPAPVNGGDPCDGDSEQDFDCSDEHPMCPGKLITAAHGIKMIKTWVK